ncbi:CPBP family intramembrane metalloprotease [Candidatus Dependentiae bacterium]|nr:CPBP family intramembrane metalloprotease [Candidatus Dependentiae bacterium]
MGNKLKKVTEKHPLRIFMIIACLLALAIIPFAIIVLKTYPNVIEDIIEVNQGKDINTNIIYSLPFALMVSGGIWMALISMAQPATASIAAIITSFILKQKEGVKELFKKFRFWSPDISPKEGLKIWFQAILLIVGINLLCSVFSNIINGVETASLFKIHTQYSLWEFVFIFLTSFFFDGGGLLEEVGWRGFVLPRLQKKFTPLKSSIILGVMWSLWHIPLKLNIWPISDFIIFYFIFTVEYILFCIVITYFYNRLGGSILIGVAIHGLINDSSGVSRIFSPASPEMHSRLSAALGTVIFLGVVLFILYKEGPMLGKKVVSSEMTQIKSNNEPGTT